MSLTSDIIAFLTSAGVVNGTTIRSSIGQESREKQGFSGPTVMIEPLPGLQWESHDDKNRGLGFRVIVRTGQHKLTDCEALFISIFDTLQDKVTEINATPGLTHQYRLIRSDQDGPITSWDSMDRPHLTAVFRCIVQK